MGAKTGVMHGRDHRGKGADPIWPGSDPVLFDFDNEGGYLYVQANDFVDLDTTNDPLSVGNDGGIYIADASGAGAIFGSTGRVVVKSLADGMQIESQVSPLMVIVNGETFTLLDDGTIHLPSGAIIGP